MALFRSRPQAPARTLIMRRKLFSVGGDFWIEDSDGNRIYHVDARVLPFLRTYQLRDAQGNQIALVQRKLASMRSKTAIEVQGRSGQASANLFGMRDRYSATVAGLPELTATGDFLGHEYGVEQKGRRVATITQKRFRLRDTYGVEVSDEASTALVLALVISIDILAGVLG